MNTANTDSMVVDGANPEMLWYNIADYIGDLSKSMIKTYNQRKRNNKAITWGELDRANRDLHNQLDIIISGDRNVIATNENKKMNKKQTVRFNESQLRRIVAESVMQVLKENGNFTYGDGYVSDDTSAYHEAQNSDKRRESLRKFEKINFGTLGDKRFEVYLNPCDSDGNIDEDNAKSFETDNLYQALNIAAQFFRSQEFIPTVSIYDNEVGEYIAEWH